jgi:hypothetical protein
MYHMHRTCEAVGVGLALARLVASCGAGPAAPTDALQILFVGNSLTETNDLPEMVRGRGARAATSPRW